MARLFWPWEGAAPVNCEEWTRRVPAKEERPLRLEGKLGSPLWPVA